MKEPSFFWRNFVTFWTQTEPYRPGETISPLVMGIRKQKIVTSCSQYKLRFPPQLIWSRQSLMNICFHDYSKTHQAGIKMFWENLMLFGTKRYQRATLQAPQDRAFGRRVHGSFNTRSKHGGRGQTLWKTTIGKLHFKNRQEEKPLEVSEDSLDIQEDLDYRGRAASIIEFNNYIT